MIQEYNNSFSFTKTILVLGLFVVISVNTQNKLHSQEKYDFGKDQVQAAPVSDFINSLGICIHYAQGIDAQSYVDPLKYLGVRNIRDDFGKPQGYVYLRKQTGVKSNIIVNTRDLDVTTESLRYIAREDALLAVEGPNEPNNFPIKYENRMGGGFRNEPGNPADWTPVAKFQRDLYTAVKTDELLKNYPVFNTSEVGAQTPNTGLQFLEIPLNSKTTFPTGTKFADYLNVHNYVSGTRKTHVDNQAWNAADPLINAGWDGLYGNHGKLWGHGYAGYSIDDLPSIPKVTTETGWDSQSDAGGEETQGKILLNTYFSQFKRGWKYTFVYMIRDGEGGGGNQGVFNKDSSPKLAAKFIHNLTTIFSMPDVIKIGSKLNYIIENGSSTTHDLLLQSRPNEFYLVVWGEKVSGEEELRIRILQGSKKIEIYDPTIGSDPIITYNSKNEFKISISDHPLIMKLSY